MTQAVNVFDYFTWVFFFCEGNHWRCAVLYNVPRLERALRMAADGCAAHTGQPVATLAFFNSLGGRRASTYSRVRDEIFTWVHAVALEKLAVETDAPPARWISSCVSVVSPLVPQQGATVVCGILFCLFFTLFSSALWRTVVLYCARVQRGGLHGGLHSSSSPVTSFALSVTRWKHATVRRQLADGRLGSSSSRSSRR